MAATRHKSTKDQRLLGSVIREAREAKRLSQEALGRKSRTDPGHVSLIEQGKTSVPLARLRRIARAVDVPASELLRRAEERAGEPAPTIPAEQQVSRGCARDA